MMELELSGNVQIVFYKPTKFCENPSRDFRGPALTNFSLIYSIYGQSSKFKGAKISRKIMESEFLHSMLICHCVQNSYEVSQISKIRSFAKRCD